MEGTASVCPFSLPIQYISFLTNYSGLIVVVATVSQVKNCVIVVDLVTVKSLCRTCYKFDADAG